MKVAPGPLDIDPVLHGLDQPVSTPLDQAAFSADQTPAQRGAHILVSKSDGQARLEILRAIVSDPICPIDETNRLVYEVTDDAIFVVACRYHYSAN